ncbi:c-type cytochrome [Abyssibius alkaniclasticus]|uniref:c-type cytochrome n=1 Tax=Abyssibius alkaniclasticus TaxID=2881234 RepID=UPI0040580EAB|tara:strand:- start:63 stop:467 length:405 start_codon:yes stop_codon:yes gene_type:complete
MKPLVIAAALFAATPVFAQGDASRGEDLFRSCKSCHTIADGDNVIVRGGRTGPNLFGIMDNPVATADFRYSDALVALAEAGTVWDDANFIAWVSDPRAFLETTLGDSAPRTRMTFKLADGAEDIAAYLRSLSAQ